MKKKLQIFISSTYTDLLEERQAAIEAILKAGHIPAGMELFTSGDQSQLEIIKQWIEDSDIYLLILGGRYGSIEEKSGNSYIEVEYDYAVELQKPLFSIVIENDYLNEKVKKFGKDFVEQENYQKYTEFRDKVLDKMSSFFTNISEVKLAIHESIRDIESRCESKLTGWVPGIVVTEKIDSPFIDLDLNVNGNWKYVITTENMEKKHFGTAKLTRKGNYFTVVGIRIESEINGEKIPDNMNWHTHWGSVCEGPMIRFDYYIESIIQGRDRGYVVLDHFETNPKMMTGKYYLLPPYSDKTKQMPYGTITFTEIITEDCSA